MSDTVEIQRCTKHDFDYIVSHASEFWGSERTLGLHHPMFLYEFGDTAYVIREGGQVIAYLFGLLSQSSPVAYVHLVGVHVSARRRGLAGALYEHFTTYGRSHGCTELKAITTPANQQSIAFHRSLGMTPDADADADGVTRDYAGPGEHRVVLRKRLD